MFSYSLCNLTETFGLHITRKLIEAPSHCCKPFENRMVEIFQYREQIIEHVEFHIIACHFPASQQLWSTPSQMCSIASLVAGPYRVLLVG